MTRQHDRCAVPESQIPQITLRFHRLLSIPRMEIDYTDTFFNGLMMRVYYSY